MDINTILLKDRDEKVLAHTFVSSKVANDNDKYKFLSFATLFAVPAAISFIAVGYNNITLFIQVYFVLFLIMIFPLLPFFIIPLKNNFTDYYVTNLRFIACGKKNYKAVSIDEIYKVKTNTTIVKEKDDQYVLYDISFYDKFNGKTFRKLSFDNIEEKDLLMNLILSLKDFEH